MQGLHYLLAVIFLLASSAHLSIVPTMRQITGPCLQPVGLFPSRGLSNATMRPHYMRTHTFIQNGRQTVVVTKKKSSIFNHPLTLLFAVAFLLLSPPLYTVMTNGLATGPRSLEQYLLLKHHYHSVETGKTNSTRHRQQLHRPPGIHHDHSHSIHSTSSPYHHSAYCRQ
jgi:hypothetical protein